jgi:preprotein translocase subunit SecF
MRIFAHAKYPFLEWRHRAYIVTAVLLIVTVVAMVRNVLDPRIGSWLEYGVDFTGGTIAQVAFRQPTTAEQLRSVLSNERGWEISQFGSGNEFIIRMPTFTQETSNDAAKLISDELTPTFGANAFQVTRTEAVGPKVGNELQERALLAILLSLGVTLVYLAFRFEWRFGLAAVVATMHDMLITLGFLAFMRMDVSLGTVAALLTIVGYSLNDTVVVFDRIREELATWSPRKEPYIDVLDRSINETLPRTVLTSVTTATTLLALLLFGGPVIRDFALVLLLGVVIGTFSSIFVASPVLYYIQTRWPAQDGTGKARGPKRRENAAVI